MNEHKSADRAQPRPRVCLTNAVFPEVIAYLEKFAEVDANTSIEPLSRDEFLARASRADALMVFMNDSLDAALLDQCPKLRVVAAALKGCDNFDVEACTGRGIWFTIVPDLLTIPTAELAIALALGLARKVLEGDRFVRSGRFAGWRAMLYGAGFSGKTAGIAGMGALGRALAARLAAFGMKILYTDPLALPVKVGKELRAVRVEPTELFYASDFLFLVMPLSPETVHTYGEDALGMMKSSAFLINVGRGSVVDEAAVAQALASGKLAGYAADVFEMEDWARADRPRSVHPELLGQADKTLFTPHLGSAVAEVRLEIEMRAARNIVEALAGRWPPDAINEPRRRAGSKVEHSGL
jgi:phosphonate dehydrogenase